MRPERFIPSHYSAGMFVIGLLVMIAGLMGYPPWFEDWPWHENPVTCFGFLVIVLAVTPPEYWD